MKKSVRLGLRMGVALWLTAGLAAAQAPAVATTDVGAAKPKPTAMKADPSAMKAQPGTVKAASTAATPEPGVAKPELVLQELVHGMPNGDSQEIRIMRASFKPGDRTVFHQHRFPVAVYILEGAFTLELEGRKPTVLKAGDGFVEPPNVKMTGYNRSTTEPLRLIIFYVSDPDTPFLDPVH